MHKTKPIEWTEIQIYWAKTSAKAIMVCLDDEDPRDGIWLPKSQIQNVPNTSQMHTIITISIPEWLACNKGLV